MFYNLAFFIIVISVNIISGTTSRQARSYPNPLNNQAADVYLVADTSSRNINRVEFEHLKSALIHVSESLLKGHPRITILFYGTSRNIDVIYQTTGSDSIAAIKQKIGQKQYVASSSNTSTLSMALDEVDRLCISFCRSHDVPRVTVVFTSVIQAMVGASQARLIEEGLGMTIIMVGIGNKLNETLLSSIASEPHHTHILQMSTYFELSASGTTLSNIITYVPRFLPIGETLYVSSGNNDYNTFQIDVTENATDSDVILGLEMTNTVYSYDPDEYFTIYGSLSHPNPTYDNAVQAQSSYQRYSDGNYHHM